MTLQHGGHMAASVVSTLLQWMQTAMGCSPLIFARTKKRSAPFKAVFFNLCWATAHCFFFTLKKIPWRTTNQKYYKITLFSLLMTISLHLFILNRYETLTSLTWEELREENRRTFLLKHTHSSMDCFLVSFRSEIG